MLNAFQRPNKAGEEEYRDERTGERMTLLAERRMMLMVLLLMIISMMLKRIKMILLMEEDLMASLMASVAVLQIAERKKP